MKGLRLSITVENISGAGCQQRSIPVPVGTTDQQTTNIDFTLLLVCLSVAL